jgi:WD40 repeat protein
MANVHKIFCAALAVALSTCGFAQAKPARLGLVPVVSDERLEDIQESPDQTRLITHDRGFAPRVWDPKTMRILRVLRGKSSPIDTVSFSPKGEWILTRGQDEVIIWDSAHALSHASIESPKETFFSTATFSPDGTKVAVGTSEGDIAVFPTLHPDQVHWWKGRQEKPEGVVTPNLILDLAFSPDGASVVSGSNNASVQLWNSAGTLLKDFSGHKASVQWVSFSPDGKQVLTTCRDNAARLFDTGTGALFKSWPHIIGQKGGGNTLMSALFVLHDESAVLVAGDDGTMRLYNRVTGDLVKELKGHTGHIREIRKSLDGTRVGTYSDTEELKLWDTESGKELPFKRPEGLPTAGQFSPDGSVFWVGYGNGTIRRHELATGEIRSETPGQIAPMALAQILGGKRIWIQYASRDGSYFPNLHNYIWNAGSLESALGYEIENGKPTFSPNGSKAAFSYEGGLTDIVDLATSHVDLNLKKFGGVAFAPDGKSLITWHTSGEIICWDTSTYKPLWTHEKLEAKDIVYSEDSTAIALRMDDGVYILIGADDGKAIATIGKVPGTWVKGVFSPEGHHFVTVSESGVTLWDLANLKAPTAEVPLPNSDIARAQFSGDGKVVAVSTLDKTTVFSTDSGAKLCEVGKSLDYGAGLPPLAIHPSKPWVVGFNNGQVRVVNYLTKAQVFTMDLNDRCNQAFFTADGARMVTIDPTDSLTIWDISTGSPKRIGNFCTSTDGDWIALDAQGRFDAHDPSHVNGVTYVMEYDKGLEPIEVSQLKSQFYEPDLLAKMLGYNKEPLRPAPDFSLIHLYPEVKLTPDSQQPNLVNISLKERDQGGIGKLSIYVNGKRVLLKEGVGYLQLNTSAYESFMLPESELKDHGNLLSVQVTNADETLTGPLVTLDLGIPKSLKAPTVNLYALCVGVGKYAGSGKKDLVAPPSDATAIGEAIAFAAEKLLPGRVHVTTLASGTGKLPSKIGIQNWFAETAKQASSTDIVLVFFAGHGTNAIGAKRDYFFLTPEADPSDVNAATATTGAISGEELRGFLSKITANKQVVILDTCHSGAAASELVADRSVSGDYERSWEALKDATGTWLLAGAAADQLSYESSNVDHGMLTYALLEAIDQEQPSAMRAGEGTMFLDVERWFVYAASRVESLKNEVGIPGVQRPELRRSASKSSFDIGAVNADAKGRIGLKAPRPIVIVGPFEKDQEDPLNLEPAVALSFKDSKVFKPWFEVAKHPKVYRVAGTYSVSGENVTVKVVLQKFDEASARKTLDTVEVTGASKDLPALSLAIRVAVEAALKKISK